MMHFAFSFAVTVITLLSVRVDSQTPNLTTVAEQLQNLQIRLDEKFLESGDQNELLLTELHLMKQSIEGLTWITKRLETSAQGVVANNDILMRNITHLTSQSENIMINQRFCANHEALRRQYFDLKPRCGVRIGEEHQPVYHSCSEAPNRSGVYRFMHSDGTEFWAFCEQKKYGGGWMVFQSRQDGSVSFNRNWSDYRNGFGDAHGEYWLGLENLNKLTAKQPTELLIIMENYTDFLVYEKYPRFWVDGESTSYALKLTTTGITGTGGDSLYPYVNARFATNDNGAGNSYAACARTLAAGFWHTECGTSRPRNNLNGIYGAGKGRQGIWWGTFEGTNVQNISPLKVVKMMIRV